MRILVIGSGGREHALCWKIAQSPKCEHLYCAPANGGIAEIAEPVELAADDIEGLLEFAKDRQVGLTVVGPEVPLVGGIVDKFLASGLKVFGPSQELAALEGSKVFAKNLMKRMGVPTAKFEVFDNSQAALDYLKTRGAPVVVKADGLCAGKGVMVCKTNDEAAAAVKSILDDKIFGPSGDRVIIEDCLFGEEASIIVVCDGKNVVPMASSQDHKRAFDGDMGPNTGGMGAYSPAPVVSEDLFKRIMDEAIFPVTNGLAVEGKPYKGVLYAGIMVTESGPKVLEFNVRFGDPETQAIMPRLKSDLVELILASIEGRLANYSLEWDRRPCVSVVIASDGYPASYEKGMEITGLDEVKSLKDVTVFHAGTKIGRRVLDKKNTIITDGGRVLNVTALGEDIRAAIDNCYAAVRMIHFDNMYYRKDIGYRALKANKS